MHIILICTLSAHYLHSLNLHILSCCTLFLISYYLKLHFVDCQLPLHIHTHYCYSTHITLSCSLFLSCLHIIPHIMYFTNCNTIIETHHLGLVFIYVVFFDQSSPGKS